MFTHKHLGWILVALGAYGMVGPSFLGTSYKPIPVWSSVEASFSFADIAAAGVGLWLILR